MRPNRFLVERNAPEIFHDEEGECAAPTGKVNFLPLASAAKP